jgi:hypothetical protein
MKHKCFISFKYEDRNFKDYLSNNLHLEMIDKSLRERINSDNEEYIMKKIREEYLSDSTVTIFLIGEHCAENNYDQNQYFIKKELQASIFNGERNTKNGILGIVLPSMYEKIYKGIKTCCICGSTHSTVLINENTVIKEFSYNYYIPNDKCAWSEEDRYCVLVKWDDFVKYPEFYIHKAFLKRDEPITSKTKVRP